MAKKVKCAGLPALHQIHDCGANRQCPNCQYVIDNSDVGIDWPGLPAGVKFDPSDVELLEHLAAKSGGAGSQPHMLIDEFIPTLNGDEGICYTHPENLPGAKKDGTSVHFFYRIVKAYSSGPRKRRRIQDQEAAIKSHVRWHKTGKTKPVLENGIQKGFKKIMVLYAASKRGSKPDKCNWVMHQYHLGTHEDETEGEFVVSKIFYQPQNVKNEMGLVIEENGMVMGQVIPKTPIANAPEPLRSEKTPPSDYVTGGYYHTDPLVEVKEYPKEASHGSFDSRFLNEGGIPRRHPTACLTGTSEAVDLSQSDSLLCNEIIDPYLILDDLKPNNSSSTQAGGNYMSQKYGNASCGFSDLDNLELDTPPDSRFLNKVEYTACLTGTSEAVDLTQSDSLLCKEIIDPYLISDDLKPNNSSSTQAGGNNMSQKYGNASCGFSDLDNLEIDTPPDFLLSDLQFPSQDSMFDWLDRM